MNGITTIIFSQEILLMRKHYILMLCLSVTAAGAMPCTPALSTVRAEEAGKDDGSQGEALMDNPDMGVAADEEGAILLGEEPAVQEPQDAAAQEPEDAAAQEPEAPSQDDGQDSEQDYYIPPYSDYYNYYEAAAEDFESALEGIEVEPETEVFDEWQLFEYYDYPEEYQIEDFKIIYQEPELPTGCEITAFTMLANYYMPGTDKDKVKLATEYLQKSPISTHTGEDGQEYGPDLNKYFVGDPEEEGLVCWPGAIEIAADSYLADHGADMQVTILNGIQPDDLYQLVSYGVPVMVWVTIGMEERMAPEGWFTEDGEYQSWSSNDHGAVLIGYTKDTVTIADPIDGIVTHNKKTFEKRFYSRKNMCLILEPYYPHDE